MRLEDAHELFGPEFDPAHYRALYGDLAGIPDAELLAHFEKFGRAEGRSGSPMAHRAAFVGALSRIRPALEIGPFCNPIQSGDGVSYLDIMTTSELKARAVEVGRDPDRVPDITYPSHDLRLVTETFDLVTSSHNIEHQPDLVRHLQQAAALLNPGGVYAMLIPDCRFCFDHFLPPSTFAGVFAAYYEGRTRHTLEAIISNRFLTTHNESVRHWAGDHGSGSPRVDKVDRAVAAFERGAYVDAHAWQFTPDSFRTIATALFNAGLIKLAPLRVYDTPHNSNEFCALLG